MSIFPILIVQVPITFFSVRNFPIFCFLLYFIWFDLEKNRLPALVALYINLPILSIEHSHSFYYTIFPHIHIMQLYYIFIKHHFSDVTWLLF